MRDHRDMKNSFRSLTTFKLHKLNALCGVWVSAAALSACVVPVGTDSGGGPASANKPAANTPPVATMSGPVLSAPSNPQRPPAPSAANSSTTSLMRDIALEIGDAVCDTDAQCRTIGVGAKACGGPEGYLAWSGKGDNTGSGKGTRLSELAAAHSAARQAENERSGMRSNCSVTPDPGAVCRPRARDGLRVCQTVQGRPSGAV